MPLASGLWRLASGVRRRAVQQPLKEQYLSTPEAAVVTLRATGALGEDVTQLTECYCVVYQTLVGGTEVQVKIDV